MQKFLVVVFLTVLVIGLVMSLVSKYIVAGGGERDGSTHLTTRASDGGAVHRQRYTTSDQMRYILYGEGTEFSAYDPSLLDYIRSHISRSTATRPRQLERPGRRSDASQTGQSALVDRLLSGRRGGFFIECGAADGEKFSNSLFFELERNWTGLLIEANPDFHRALLEKNRRAYVLGTCLSTELRPMTVRMQPDGLFGGIVNTTDKSVPDRIGALKKPEVSVLCFPLNSIMAALDVSYVDYLSLDVEGPELEILRTVDWSQLRIDVVTVEYRILGDKKFVTNRPATLSKLRDLRKFFNDTGLYREVAVLPHGSDARGLDVVFTRI